MELAVGISLAVTCCALAVAAFCAWTTLPLRARIESLEVERAVFVAQMNGLVEECNETLARADKKRKRAENLERSLRPEGEETPQPTLAFRRGSIMEKLG